MLVQCLLYYYLDIFFVKYASKPFRTTAPQILLVIWLFANDGFQKYILSVEFTYYWKVA